MTHFLYLKDVTKSKEQYNKFGHNEILLCVNRMVVNGDLYSDRISITTRCRRWAENGARNSKCSNFRSVVVQTNVYKFVFALAPVILALPILRVINLCAREEEN